MKNFELNDRLASNFSLILDNADTGYVLYNSSMSIMAFNEQAQKFANTIYNKELSAGNYILTYFPEERHEHLLKVIERVSGGELVIYEVSFNVNGREVWLETKWLCVKNIDNDGWGFILASKDITDTKLQLLKLEQANQELEDRNKILEQFGHIVGHNLKTPVANISTIIELLNSSDDDTERNLYLDYINSSAQALTGVVGDIGQLLSIKRTLAEAREKIHFGNLLDEIKKTINYLVVKEHLSIHTDIDDNLSVLSIKSFINSLFYNLISNSIKYRRFDVFPKVEITVKKEKNGVLIRFRDNGKGIDLEKYGHKLFGIYNRFDTTVEGTGLGLYMVKTQIEQIGGKIDVESQLGQGTVFTIEIPDLAA